MNKSVELNAAIARLCPEFDNGNWSVNDAHLAKEVEHALSASTKTCEHFPYLAESICLDNFKTDTNYDRISQLLIRIAKQHISDSDQKCLAIKTMCDEALNNQNPSGGSYLEKLLLAQPSRAAHIELINSPTLEILKNTKSVKRVGDTVFIPPHPDVYVIGDTHGDATSINQVIRQIESTGDLDNGAYVVFLGDYTCNGMKSYDTLVAILDFKEAYPDAIVLLNGNHEFKESYQTVLYRYLSEHWERFSDDELPAQLQDRTPALNNHYEHLRTELIRRFGFGRGEDLYNHCVNWGQNLPCICVSGDLMISHSLGMVAGADFTLENIVNAKHREIDDLQTIGYEIWGNQRNTQHAQLTNNRIITADIVDSFSALFGVNEFVVGHTHYRSGDTSRIGRGNVTTIVSSNPYSPDTGHFMYHQMHVDRNDNRAAENLADGDAVPGYLRYKLLAKPKRIRQLLSFTDF